MADKQRIHQLAKELSVDSKAILAKCRAEGVEVKNHMSTVSAGLEATIREWFSEETSETAIEVTEKVDLKKVRKKRAPARVRQQADAETERTTTSAVHTHNSSHAANADDPRSGGIAVVAPPGQESPDTGPSTEPAFEPEPGPLPAVAAEAEPQDQPQDQPSGPGSEPAVQQPVGPQNVPQPAQLKGPRVIRVEAPESVGPPPRARSASPRYRQTTLSDRQPDLPPAADAGTAARRTRSKTYHSQDAVEPRRAKPAASRRGGRGSPADKIREWRDRDLAERQERLRGATGRRAKRRASEGRGSVEHKTITEAVVTEPLILKDFCAATGLSMSQLTPYFVKELKIIPNINMMLDRETAERLANAFEIDLTVVAARSPLDDIRTEFGRRERPHTAVRAPVVTFLGHVDHGKTSLLDAIRHTRVTAGEAGGITQHVGSYHLQKGDLAVTFLDTPGHEAFTAMRARGAQMTDVVVLVVACDDGVMPQTLEAINHAKAAEVPIVVALNKVDLPGVDINKVYGQLAEHQLAPTQWGGQTDVIHTSATTGEGIDALVEHLSTLSELLELRADPTVAACGRVIEAQMRPGVGVVARLLIQDGSLQRGSIIVCGSAFGKVRLIKDDQGRTLDTAGPSMPVEISGLDELPGAGDEFFQVASLRRAEQIAEESKLRRRRDSLSTFNKPKTLEDLFGQRKAGEIPELNVIVKADVQGSSDVLRKSLSEFPSDQVKLNILHAGVGAISESDVLLAEASGAIVIGFQVVADTHVKRLADEKGVDVRLYRVIYNVIDEIKKALEGLLEPEEKLEPRGVAEVRDVFKVSKVGSVAGCLMREGNIARDHRVRIIRDGVVVRDQAKLQSLRRFKDDVKEVKAGYECGIKVDGFDDVKPGDVIESYEIVKIARKL